MDVAKELQAVARDLEAVSLYKDATPSDIEDAGRTWYHTANGFIASLPDKKLQRDAKRALDKAHTAMSKALLEFYVADGKR